jgi:hypothetical protein
VSEGRKHIADTDSEIEKLKNDMDDIKGNNEFREKENE